jgi:carboxypeptidase T
VVDDTRYASHGWGTEPVQAVAAARYSVDVPAWNGGPVFAMAPGDGAFDSPVEAVVAEVDTTGWAPGRHLIFVEGQDAAGHWGVPSAAFLWIEEHFGLDVAASPADGRAAPGRTTAYSVTVTNTGHNAADTFTVDVEAGWPVMAAATIGPLASGISTTLPITVIVPPTARDGDADAATLTVTSQSDPRQAATFSLHTVADVAAGGELPPPGTILFLPAMHGGGTQEPRRP